MSILVEPLNIGQGHMTAVVKDTIDIAGIPTRAGSRAFSNAAPAATNAAVVDSLLASGYKITGKANLHELAFGVTGINKWTGTPRNPQDDKLVPGGSSSGSAAAVASGLADLALGTDTGGSIRVPAACCGVFGLKPTFGRISRHGILPGRSSLDCVGPMARDIDGIIRAMQAMDPAFDLPQDAGETKLALLRVPAHPIISAAVERALAAAGIHPEMAALPTLAAAFDAALAIINRETSQAFGHLVETGLVGDDVATRLQAAAKTSDQDVSAAENTRRIFRQAVDNLLQQVDALALPTLPHLPPTIEDAEHNRSGISLTALTRPFNLSGHPAISVPIPSTSGLSIGLQLVARHGDDARLCAIAKRIHLAAWTD